MKKILALTLSLAMVLPLAACGGDKGTGTPAPQNSTAAGVENSAAPAASGEVYYLNFKPEQNDAWQELAKAYTEETGVPVTVVTAASGTYEQTLMSEIAKSNPPLCSRSTAPWVWPTGRITAWT